MNNNGPSPSKSHELLTLFVVSNLPDSVQERKALLTALMDVLPKDHALKARVRSMLGFLVSHENQQLEFRNLLP